MTARTRRPCRKPFPLAAGILFLIVISLIQPAQAQSLYIVDQFDPSGIDGYSYAAGQITNVWGNWFGDAFQSLSWDSTSDASNNPNSGSMRIVANFNGLGSIPNQFEVYDYIDSITPAPPGWVCTNFECDVRFAAGSATVTVNGTSTFGYLQFGIETPGYGQDYFGGITIPASNTNWVHVSIPLNVVADTNLLDIGDVLIHIYGPYYSPGLSGVTTLWVDNIAFTCAPLPPTNCVIDWNNVHQRIDGFGASSAWDGSWTSAQASMFFSTNSGRGVSFDNTTNFSFNGIGLSLLRSRIAPGGTTWETSIMQMAQSNGAAVWSTPWSPAAQFKSNTNVDGGSFVGTPANYQAYASQQAAYVAAMKNQYGINLYAISVQNEPDADVTNYESCNWTSQQIHDFVPYLYNALAASNVASTRIMLPESQNWQDYSNLAVTPMTDPNVAAQVGIIADHNYDGSYGPANLTKTNYGKALWETEVSTFDPFDGSISNAVYWAQRIHLFMTQAQANAWNYWWLVPAGSDNEGLTDTNGIPALRMYALGNFSRFVRPGFYCVGVSNNSFTSVSAYRSTNSGSFAIVAINPGPDMAIQTFDLTNFTATSVTPWITSSNYSLGSQPPLGVANITFSYPLPAMSVVTFVGQGYVAPSSIAISNAAFGSSGLVLTWNSSAGSSYSVLKANGAAPPISNWTAIVTSYPPGGAGNGWLSYTDTTVTTAGGPGFYRVRSP
jgi:glucuronoarabinoxylan endo-1,4-beta-xylanase